MSSSAESFNNNRRGLSEEGFELYRMYCALKAHFKSKSYDYVKSKGAISVSRSAYAKRRDAPFFTSLAKNSKDHFGILLSNILHDPNTWIGDIDPEKINSVYNDWKRRTDQLEYYFKSDLNVLKDGFIENFSVDKFGNHPYILELALEGEINFETFAILVSFLSLNKTWDRQISDVVLAPKVIDRAVKYHPFLVYNRDSLKQVFKARWREALEHT